MITPVPIEPCPGCGFELNHSVALAAETSRPIPGDFAICSSCGLLLRFDDKLHRRAATALEMADNMTPHMRAVALQAQRIISMRGPLR